MSYLVFARKWRPQVFDDVVAQEYITHTLKNSIQSGKLAHAYLFVGPRGVGKTSCARILAKCLNCKDAPTIKPCGECSACREISEGRSLDVIEIDGASNRGIDEIRTLRENVKFTPVLGKYKIYIIDEVHMLTQEAFNALLKTLEEPPEHVKFIFATTRPDKILPTILSRCQRFEFSRIPTLKIISKLEEIAKEEKISVQRDCLFNIAKISDGSMRDAESVLDQLASFSKDKIEPSDVVEVMGLIEQELYFEFLEAIKNKDAQFCIDFIAKLFKRGKNIANFLEGLLWHLRNLMLAKIMESNLEELLDLPTDVVDRTVEQSKILSLAEIVNLFTAVTNTQDMAKKLGSFRIPLEVMIVKLTQSLNSQPQTQQYPTNQTCKPDETKTYSVDEQSAANSEVKKFSAKIKLDNIGSLFFGAKAKDSAAQEKNLDKEKLQESPNAESINNESGTQAQPSDMKVQPQQAVEVAPQIDFQTILNRWSEVRDAISKKKMSLATYLKDSRPIRLEDRVLVIGFPKVAVFYKEAVEQKNNQKVIINCIEALFKRVLDLKFELSEDSDSQIDDTLDSESSYLKSALDTFKGRLFEKG